MTSDRKIDPGVPAVLHCVDAARHVLRVWAMAVILGMVLVPAPAVAQSPAAPDTLSLVDLRAAAIQHDPRATNEDLLDRALRLQQRSILAQRLPDLSLSGEATLQSEVASVPVDVQGLEIPEPSRAQYQAQAETEWMLFQGRRVSRQLDAEALRALEAIAGTQASLDVLQTGVTEQYFGVLLLQARSEVLESQASALAARRDVLQKQADEGAALQANVAAIAAETNQAEASLTEVRIDERAARAVLSDLSGRPVPADAQLTLPDLDEATAPVRQQLMLYTAGPPGSPGAADTSIVGRLLDDPEVERLQHQADRLRAESRVQASALWPSVRLFGQAGVGQPNPLNPFSDEASPFALGGVGIRWKVFDWGRVRNSVEAQRVRAQTVEHNADARIRQIGRNVQDELSLLQDLDRLLENSQETVELRRDALRAAQQQLDEGLILPDLYADRLAQLTSARFAYEQYRIERARAQARLLSELGRFPDHQETSNRRP